MSLDILESMRICSQFFKMRRISYIQKSGINTQCWIKTGRKYFCKISFVTILFLQKNESAHALYLRQAFHKYGKYDSLPYDMTRRDVP